MYEQKNRFDDNRVYACRCPACKRAMNVPGVTLNTEKHIRCWNCNALGRVDKWIEGGRTLVHRNGGNTNE